MSCQPVEWIANTTCELNSQRILKFRYNMIIQTFDIAFNSLKRLLMDCRACPLSYLQSARPRPAGRGSPDPGRAGWARRTLQLHLLWSILEAFFTNAILQMGRIGIITGPFFTLSALNQSSWSIVVNKVITFAILTSTLTRAVYPISIGLWAGLSTNMAVEAGLMFLQTLRLLCLISSHFSINDIIINYRSKGKKPWDTCANRYRCKPVQNSIWAL